MSQVLPTSSQALPRVERTHWLRSIANHFLVRRIAKALFTIMFVTSLLFFLIRLMPSNPLDIYIQELISQYSMTYDDARNQAAAMFAIPRLSWRSSTGQPRPVVAQRGYTRHQCDPSVLALDAV
jgi:hypothetical protein